MPIAICRACKSYAGKAIDYVTNEKKAELIYTHGLDESRSLSQQFIDTAKLYDKGDKFNERKYYHLKFSFEPKDNIENGGKLDAELAKKISNEYLQKHYSGNEYVLAIHTDKEHIHAHVIINAVSFETGKKIQHSNRDLANMKDEINDISEKYEISRFDWKQAVKNKRQLLKQEPKELTQAITRDKQYQQNRTGEQPAERELSGVHSSIREIEERTKCFSGTGREEIRERQRAEQAKLEKLAREQREKAERIEQEHKRIEEQQQNALRRNRSHSHGFER